MDLLWSKTFDVILKTLIAGEHPIVSAMRRNCSFRTNCFEIFGFDILIDSDLKPWLLEVNLAPSLTPDSAMDHRIKSNLVADTLNLIGLTKFDRRRESMNKMRSRMKQTSYKQKPTYKNLNTKTLFDEDDRKIKFSPISKDLEREIANCDKS